MLLEGLFTYCKTVDIRTVFVQLHGIFILIKDNFANLSLENKEEKHLNKMDIAYMKTSVGLTNDSDFVHSDFIEQNLGIAIPYLIIISLCTLSGCVGNIIVFGCVLCYKVFFRFWN